MKTISKGDWAIASARKIYVYMPKILTSNENRQTIRIADNEAGSSPTGTVDRMTDPSKSTLSIGEGGGFHLIQVVPVERVVR